MSAYLIINQVTKTVTAVNKLSDHSNLKETDKTVEVKSSKMAIKQANVFIETTRLYGDYNWDFYNHLF
jgi:hypothetical protein